MKKVGFLVLAMTFLSCSSVPTNEPLGKPNASTDYEQTVNKWTMQSRKFDTLIQTYQAAGTLLSRELTESQVNQQSDMLNWTPEQKQEARQKALYDLQSQTSFMVSIFTQKDEDNNLDKSNSVWNVFLEVNGKRLTPQSVKRVYENRATFIIKYPHALVWSRNYYVVFSIPTDEAVSNNAELTLAGPFGTAHMKYPTN